MTIFHDNILQFDEVERPRISVMTVVESHIVTDEIQKIFSTK